ncbi:MAG: sulfotransferase [Geminicoccaceae bacterium]|nr:sulfotransferase [Geminicoccaceae bacterium]
MSDTPAMEMPGWLDMLGGLVERAPGFWRRVGGLESNANRDALDAIRVDRPVYVAGLARSGSTILLELLAGHPDTATHQYRDFPMLFAPVFWNRAFGQVYSRKAEPAERAHKDRILVTPDSPEAMEEMLWMGFFPRAHDLEGSHVLDGRTANPAFEVFYRDHVRKILLIRGGTRYLSKGNYNLTRLAYLRKLFPDARFIVPVREPRWHVASLLKQHRLFAAEERRDPRILKHMRRVGHFEFGLDRRVVNVGDDDRARSIDRLWHEGADARGYARLWATLYGFVQDQLAADLALAAQTLILRYEDLCADPKARLRQALDHAGLDLEPAKIDAAAARVSPPTYYSPDFSPEDEAAIREETEGVAARYGYG